MALGYNATIPLAFGTGGVTLPVGGTNGDFLVKTSIGLGWASVNSGDILSKSGDTMTGPLILSGDPTDPNGAATKAFTESLVEGLYDVLNPEITDLGVRVSDSEGAITYLLTTAASTTVELVNTQLDVAALQTEVPAIQTDITALQASVAANTTDITALQTTVGTHTSDITALESSVSDNTSDISSLQTDVGDNTTDISVLQLDVTSNTADIAGNTSDISALQTSVSGNTTDISDLTTDLNTVSVGLTLVETTVSGHTTDISGLQADVTSNTTAISTNASNITTLQSTVSQHTVDIGDLEASTSANGLAITALGTQVSGNASDIDSLESDVAGLETALEWKLDISDHTLANLDITATAVELNYCTGLTTSVQTQLNLLDADMSAVEAGLVDKLDSVDFTLDGLGITASSTEINYLTGTTSGVQSQLDAKLTYDGELPTGDTTSQLEVAGILSGDLRIPYSGKTRRPLIEANTGVLYGKFNDIGNFRTFRSELTGDGFKLSRYDLVLGNEVLSGSVELFCPPDLSATYRVSFPAIVPTVNKYLMVDGSDATKLMWGDVPVTTLTSLGVTATSAELNYVDGVTSSIQTQLDSKAAASSVVVPTVTSVASTGQLLRASTNTNIFKFLTTPDNEGGVTVTHSATLGTYMTVTVAGLYVITAGLTLQSGGSVFLHRATSLNNNNSNSAGSVLASGYSGSNSPSTAFPLCRTIRLAVNDVIWVSGSANGTTTANLQGWENITMVRIAN